VCFYALNLLLQSNIGIGDEPDDGWNSTYPAFTNANETLPANPTRPATERDWFDLIADANSYLSVHLLFTWIFTLITLRFIYANYRRFVKARQLFALELVHSIPARTVMVSRLPNHLRGERALAEHFERMSLAVESVSVVREVGGLKLLINKRTKALLELENAWVDYVGNPSTIESYDPSDHAILGDGDPNTVESQPQGRVVVPHRKRPTIRLGWFSKPVDALEHLEQKYLELDEAVRRRRRLGRFKATDVAFVTFEKMSSAVC
jgi:calcium permeable stress-gated cation channel